MSRAPSAGSLWVAAQGAAGVAATGAHATRLTRRPESLAVPNPGAPCLRFPPARSKARRRPLAANYFAYPARGVAGEQFGAFAALAAWLLQACGLQVASPKDYDDPNATLAALLTATRALGGPAGSVATAVPGTRLTAGWGPEVAALLDALAGAALERRPPALEAPSFGGLDG